MKIRTLYAFTRKPELAKHLQQLSLHANTPLEVYRHEHLLSAPPALAPDNQFLHQLKRQNDAFLCLIDADADLTYWNDLRRQIATHLRDQAIAVQIAPSIECVERSLTPHIDFVMPEALSLLQYEELLSLAQHQVQLNVERRFSSALRILAHEVGAQIDQIAHLRKKGYRASISEAVLHDMKGSIQKLTRSEKAQFFREFAEYCETAQPAAQEFRVGAPYVGVSSRVRKKSAEKARTRLNAASEKKRRAFSF
ncbi:hypothetical protein MRY87_09355 [bacterium]|nr:hypothetical protein [bacterium]